MSGSSGAEAGFTNATALSKDVLCKHARSNQRRSAKHERAPHDHLLFGDLPENHGER